MVDWSRGKHNFKFGAEVQHVAADFYLGVFQQGRIEAVENFPDFDRNGDGQVTWDDLLFAVTLQSHYPDRPLVLPNDNNNYLAFFAQDDWHVTPQLTLNLGLRYDLDTNSKDISYYSQINPIVQPFLHGTRGKDTNNLGPAHRLQLGQCRRQPQRAWRIRHLLRPHHAGNHVAGARSQRHLAAHRRSRRQCHQRP